MKRAKNGFTIIELIVVVTVIGILAGIVFVNYNNAQIKARNADRAAEMHNWKNLFELYYANYGQYPPVANGNYCLGFNFPLGSDGQARCRDSAMTDPNYSYLQSGNAQLMTYLQQVGTIPTNQPVRVGGDLVGPYMVYWGTGMSITEVFEGGKTDCPPSMKYSWDNGNGAVLCYMSLGH